jgi:hypothetical protein
MSALKLLRSRWNADLSDDQADAILPLVNMALDSLALLVTSSFARDPPYNAEK